MIKKASPALLLCLALACGSGCVNNLFYYPTHTVYQTPARNQLPYEPVLFKSEDGTALSGWFIPAIGKPLGTVIHFHGNAQNMTAHYSFVDFLPAAGFNVFVFDYRGYGASKGTPSRRGLYEDSVAAIRYVQGRSDVDPDRILILAQSIGAANAIAALGNNDFKGIRAIVIDSGFYSYRGIVRDKIALIPVLSLLRWPLSYIIVSNGYSPEDYVGRLPRVPIVFIEGTKDPVVPPHHAVDLYEAAHDPKSLWIVPNGGHADAFGKYRQQFAQPLEDFFRKALEAKE